MSWDVELRVGQGFLSLAQQGMGPLALSHLPALLCSALSLYGEPCALFSGCGSPSLTPSTLILAPLL